MHTALRISVIGRVQGVGFRPFVFQSAAKYKLNGTVQNNMDGVKILLEGEESSLDKFIYDLKNHAPRLSKINKISIERCEPSYVDGFTIIESDRSGSSLLVIPIDSAICKDCLKEMQTPTDFRYRYPFINCTQCGPRYTIINELPYDRPFTTMKDFEMCPECQTEYNNPLNRRHHAQPIACPKCGPNVKIFDGSGEERETDDAIKEIIHHIIDGRIVAVKGIGGYHLCCDARNEAAVATLRNRKNRPKRPLAVMAASIEAAKQFGEIGELEERWLGSPESPIVIIRKKESSILAPSVAPDMETIGVMLPYSPLHYLLLENQELPVIVMTSANPSGLPILYKNEEAFHYLNGIADFFLIHNREILHPSDDSVIQLINGKVDFLRRSRGFVPEPIATKLDVNGIVGFGGQQKTTFSIGRNEQIFVGPHIGDLENIETINHYKRELDHLLNWIDIPKKIAVVDAHPGYSGRSFGRDYDFECVIEVQHHHAHMASCMEEHQLEGKTLGIILDGTGYGLDGKIWGFEIFYGDRTDFERLAHLKYTPLPGSEKCIKEPWRNAVAMLISLLGEEGEKYAKQIFCEKNAEIETLSKMVDNKINTVYAGTCGRLFDAVSAMCNITLISSFDGEAAIQLSELADVNKILPPYPYSITNDGHLLEYNFSETLKQIALDMLSNVNVQIISNRFHETVVQALLNGIERLLKRDASYYGNIVLSGGSFHNRYLKIRLIQELKAKGLKVFTHENVPCNDGGLSFGQVAIAAARRRTNQCALEYQLEL